MLGAPPLTCATEFTFEEVFLGWGLTIGVLVSFLPQILTLIIRKVVDGLSMFSSLLNYWGNALNLVNVVLLQWSLFVCCKSMDSTKCANNLLPILQLIPPALCCGIILVLFTMYAPKRGESYSLLSKSQSDETNTVSKFSFSSLLSETSSHSLHWLVASLIITIIALGIGIIVAFVAGYWTKSVTVYAYIIGILAAIFQIVLYIPQIYVTYKARESGSLSVVTLIIQVPGSLLVVYYQGIVSRGSWSTWLPYLCSAVQQMILICQCAYYAFLKWRAKRYNQLSLLENSEPL